MLKILWKLHMNLNPQLQCENTNSYKIPRPDPAEWLLSAGLCFIPPTTCLHSIKFCCVFVLLLLKWTTKTPIYLPTVSRIFSADLKLPKSSFKEKVICSVMTFLMRTCHCRYIEGCTKTLWKATNDSSTDGVKRAARWLSVAEYASGALKISSDGWLWGTKRMHMSSGIITVGTGGRSSCWTRGQSVHLWTKTLCAERAPTCPAVLPRALLLKCCFVCLFFN